MTPEQFTEAVATSTDPDRRVAWYAAQLLEQLAAANTQLPLETRITCERLRLALKVAGK